MLGVSGTDTLHIWKGTTDFMLLSRSLFLSVRHAAAIELNITSAMLKFVTMPGTAGFPFIHSEGQLLQLKGGMPAP